MPCRGGGGGAPGTKDGEQMLEAAVKGCTPKGFATMKRPWVAAVQLARGVQLEIKWRQSRVWHGTAGSSSSSRGSVTSSRFMRGRQPREPLLLPSFRHPHPGDSQGVLVSGQLVRPRLVPLHPLGGWLRSQAWWAGRWALQHRSWHHLLPSLWGPAAGAGSRGTGSAGRGAQAAGGG